MRRSTIGILAVTAAMLAGCGGGSTFANLPRPPTPVDLTVYISNQRVLVSTGPITPQATAQVTVNFNTPNQDYTITTSPTGGKTDASRAVPQTVKGASLHIGRSRASAANTLLQP
jgi:hypothetical protein